MLRRTSISGAITASLLLVALPGAGAHVDEVAPEPIPAPIPAATELADGAVSLWDQLRDALLPEPADPALGRAVALRLFQVTAGGAVSDVPLPVVAGGEIPALSVVPVRGAEPSSAYGTRRDPIHGRAKQHNGVDFPADRGEPVYAAAAGVVVKAEYHRGYGRVVYIDHGAGFVTRYAHLSAMLVREGDTLGAGERIGAVGSSGRATGPHLHFELRVLGKPIDPLPALGIERRRLSERLGDLLKLPFREHRGAQRGRRDRDRT